MAEWLVRAVVSLICFLLSFEALNAVNWQKILKADRPREAQLLYWLLAMGLGGLAAQFLLGFIYH